MAPQEQPDPQKEDSLRPQGSKVYGSGLMVWGSGSVFRVYCFTKAKRGF